MWLHQFSCCYIVVYLLFFFYILLATSGIMKTCGAIYLFLINVLYNSFFLPSRHYILFSLKFLQCISPSSIALFIFHPIGIAHLSSFTHFHAFHICTYFYNAVTASQLFFPWTSFSTLLFHLLLFIHDALQKKTSIFHVSHVLHTLQIRLRIFASFFSHSQVTSFT